MLTPPPPTTQNKNQNHKTNLGFGQFESRHMLMVQYCTLVDHFGTDENPSPLRSVCLDHGYTYADCQSTTAYLTALLYSISTLVDFVSCGTESPRSLDEKKNHTLSQDAKTAPPLPNARWQNISPQYRGFVR